MQSLQQTQEIRSLVKNYTVVPGLVLAIIGAYAAFTGAFDMLWDYRLYYELFGRDSQSSIANLAAFGSIILPYALFVVVIYAVGRYYKRHFGQVTPRAEEKRLLTIEIVVAMGAYFFVGEVLDTRFHLGVSTTLLIFAMFLIVHWWMFARRQIHYVVLAAIAVGLSFVPLVNAGVYHWLYVYSSAPDWYGFNTAICAGTLLLIAGLLDHWYMVRAFARVRTRVQANMGRE